MMKCPECGSKEAFKSLDDLSYLDGDTVIVINIHSVYCFNCNTITITDNNSDTIVTEKRKIA